MIDPAVARRRRISDEERLAREIVPVLGRMLADRTGRIALLVIVLVAALAAGGYYLYERYQRQHENPPVVVQPPGSTEPGPSSPAGRVRIATWNLRKFSDRVENPPDLVTIARIIRENDFDLLAIQEVQQQGQVVQKLRRQLNEPWRVAITEQTGNHERYAFLYREDRVELTQTPKLAEGPDAEFFDRRPASASFKSGQFDFVLVTVHLWYGDKANNPRRRNEAAALARIASGIAASGAEKDVIVLGDFNEMRTGGNLPIFETMGWQRLNREPTNLGSSEVFDNLVIDPKYTREYAGASGVVRFDETIFANDDKRALSAVSDHRPVYADFNTTGPDDD
jgi:endonuclease/exonuclease/phosphatase family metal-dependent hydrolase